VDRPVQVFDTQFNVVAAFRSPADAEVALERLADHDVPHSAILVHRPDEPVTSEQVAEERAEMQDELGASFVGPGLVMSGVQARGALHWAATLGGAGLLVGLAAGSVWGYAFDSSLSGVARLAMAAYITTFAGLTFGLVTGGGLAERFAASATAAPEPDDEPILAERDVLVAIHAGDAGLAERAAGLLLEHGAERVHLVDGFGTPLPPQAAHPRPADPDGWWWRRAGCG
jgi:hypothetical protein